MQMASEKSLGKSSS